MATHDFLKEEIQDNGKKLHIAMFPWLAFGHILPYLELAKLIAQRGHKVSFISTPRNIDRLPKLPPNLSQSITFVKLPLPSVPGLPISAEATSDLDPEKVLILKKAHDLLKDPMAELLDSIGPATIDWLFLDFAAFWLPGIAREMGIKTVFFSIMIASALGYIGVEFPSYRKSLEDFASPPKWVPFPSTVTLSRHTVARMLAELKGDGDDVSLIHRFTSVMKGCDVVAVRSSWEIERNYLSLLGELLQKPVVPVGQLPPATANLIGEGVNTERGDSWQEIKGWLDEQEEGFVVYVAFGSEAEWSESELAEIAVGLELSGLPFFWVLRARPDSDARLPDGFEDRVGRRGYICCSWVPQVKILAHSSVGAFLNHSGWSSVVESLQFSKPLVLLASYNDQEINLKALEERNMGFPVPRDENNGSFTREAVAESLRIVVIGEEGKVYREKAKEVSGMFSDRKVQDKYVDELLSLLYKTSHAMRAYNHQLMRVKRNDG